MFKAIVTGGTGYIGSHVVKLLLSKGWAVAVINRAGSGLGYLESIADETTIFEFDGDVRPLIDFFTRTKADVVMHLAAAVLTAPDSTEVSTLIRSNVEFGTQILEAMSSSSTRLFVGTGTYWQNYNSATYNPVDLYAATKEAFEKILKYYVDARDIKAATLRLYDVYGEDDCRPKLWTLLRDIAGTEKTLNISAGEQLLDMVHVSDVAIAYVKAFEWLRHAPQKTNEVFGVSSGSQLPLREIVETYQRIMDRKINLNWGARPYKQREVMIPFHGYRPLPDWRPSVSLQIGLTKFNNRGGVNFLALLPPCLTRA